MNNNIGKIDKVLRIVVGIAIIAYGVFAQSWLGLIGIVPLGTALIGWCPLYCPLGLSTTCSTDKCSKK